MLWYSLFAIHAPNNYCLLPINFFKKLRYIFLHGITLYFDLLLFCEHIMNTSWKWLILFIQLILKRAFIEIHVFYDLTWHFSFTFTFKMVINAYCLAFYMQYIWYTNMIILWDFRINPKPWAIGSLKCLEWESIYSFQLPHSTLIIRLVIRTLLIASFKIKPFLETILSHK